MAKHIISIDKFLDAIIDCFDKVFIEPPIDQNTDNKQTNNMDVLFNNIFDCIMSTFIELAQERASSDNPSNVISYRKLLSSITSKFMTTHPDGRKRLHMIKFIACMAKKKFKYLKFNDTTHFINVHKKDGYYCFIDKSDSEKFDKLKKDIAVECIGVSEDKYNSRKPYKVKAYDFIIYAARYGYMSDIVDDIVNEIESSGLNPSVDIYIV